MLHTNIYSALMYGLFSRMVATFEIPKKPQTSHIRQMAVVHAQINLHMYSSADNTQCVHTKTCWASWKPLKQQLPLAKIGVTDLLLLLSCITQKKFLVDVICFHYKPTDLPSDSTDKHVCSYDSFEWELKLCHLSLYLY